MKQEQLLDDTRESEIVDRTLLFLLVVGSIVCLYLSKIAILTTHNRSPFNDEPFSSLLGGLGFVAGAFLCYFFHQSKWIVIIGSLIVMIFCAWEVFVLAIGNYFDNWLHVYLHETGTGMIISSLAYTYLSGSYAFGKKQTYYIYFIYLFPIFSLLIGINKDQYILPENTGLLPIVICFLLISLGIVLYLKERSFISSVELSQDQTNPNISLISFWVFLIILLFIFSTALFCNIPPGIDVDQFFDNIGLLNLSGSIGTGLFASIVLLRWGAFPYKKLMKIGIITLCTSALIYCGLFFFNEYFNAHYLIFQTLIQLIMASGHVILISLLSYLILFNRNKYFIFIISIFVIPNIFISSIQVSIGFIDSIKLLNGNIFYIILLLTAISSVLFLLYLNRTNNLIPNDERTDRLQP